MWEVGEDGSIRDKSQWTRVCSATRALYIVHLSMGGSGGVMGSAFYDWLDGTCQWGGGLGGLVTEFHVGG